jgi:hypothetical protein
VIFPPSTVSPQWLGTAMSSPSQFVALPMSFALSLPRDLRKPRLSELVLEQAPKPVAL